MERQSLWKRTNYEPTITKIRGGGKLVKKFLQAVASKKIHAEGSGLPMEFMHQKFHRIHNDTSLAKLKRQLTILGD